MKIELVRMELQNFKGIKSFVLTPDCKDVEIFGDNETGKTTLADASNWLFFGKDTRGRADFEIKTIIDNKVQHSLEHGVTAAFKIIDGSGIPATVELKRLYRELWPKKHGGSRPETFTGHETKFFIDGVPRPKKEYDEYIKNLVGDKVFNIVTDPRFFNDSMPWKERRDVLLNISTSVFFEDVIKSNPDLSGVLSIIGKNSVDDHKTIINARQKKINEELKEIPARIDELKNGLPEVLNVETLRADILDVKVKKAAVEKEKNDLLLTGSGPALSADMSRLKKELHVLNDEHETEKIKLSAGVKKEISMAESLIEKHTNGIAGLKKQIESETAWITEKKAFIDSEGQRWAAIDAEQFEFDNEDFCPTCGQSIPAEQVREARERALMAFNKDNAMRLNKIDMAETALWTEIDARSKDLLKSEESRKHLKIKFAEATETKSALDEKLFAIESTPPPAAVADKGKEIKDKQVEIDADVKPDTTGLDKSIDALEEYEKLLNKKIASQEVREDFISRISEMEDQEKTLAAEYEKLEKDLNLLDQYTAAESTVLESKINDKFQLCQWKLFDRQINQGIKETCVCCTKDGIPWGSMNNAAQVNCGLDCINVLSDFFNFYAPIWIDNAEAVTKFIDTKAQIIRLNVSVDHKTITVI